MLILPLDAFADDAHKVVDYEDWAQHVAEKPLARPERKLLVRRGQMSDVERWAFDEHRIAFVARAVCNTPAMAEVNDQLMPLLRTNRLLGKVPRAGIGLDGLGSYGKTTIVLELGRRWERSLRERHHLPFDREVATPDGNRWIPVAFVTLSGETTERGVLESIADYFRIPERRRGATNSDRQRAIVNVMVGARTELLIVDDFHHLKPRSKSYDAASEFLKTLVNQTSVTPVIAGVQLLEAGLFDEGGQSLRTPTAGRIARVSVESYRLTQEHEAYAWNGLVKDLESTIVLANQKAGDLVKLEMYLFQRTGGVVGSLARVLRIATTMAIEHGTERITKKLLDQITLDHAAESAYAEMCRNSGPPSAKGTDRVATGSNTSKPKQQPRKRTSGPSELARRGRGVQP